MMENNFSNLKILLSGEPKIQHSSWFSVIAEDKFTANIEFSACVVYGELYTETTLKASFLQHFFTLVEGDLR